MNKILMLVYAICGIIAIGVFYSMNLLTQPVNNDDYWGGNGNPALFIPVVAMPFILYFLYGTTELSMRANERWLLRKGTIGGILISTTYILAASFFTYNKAFEFRKYIVDVKGASSYPEEFALFNVFSTHIFLNPLTFILVVMVCFLTGAVWSLARNRKEKVQIL
ncbi:hypothetical protein QOZ98_000354 [Planomicrobium stackebrandtii]|uniref:DUF1648 domain-containing protein n=1 Tax=Planomicrobium stackebrandtii TaxID=253160 RepID=A0ABU0GQ96_9BACL|nr:hypothetical protein [Planomicrobium stackebrandtii]MDQ0427529.1 hypothetical protein [Planomicrobium stackebrandtii]